MDNNSRAGPKDMDWPYEVFEQLNRIREEHGLDHWQDVLKVMQGEDLLLAMEAEQVLKELQPDLPAAEREQVERELLAFSAKIAMARSNSSL